MKAPSPSQVQRALFRIAELASAAQDLQEFYRAVHAVVGELMNAENFFIALYDAERELIGWPYYVDETDDDIPDPNEWDKFGSGHARGTTAYVLRTGEPCLLTFNRMRALMEQGEVELVGVLTEESTWLGVPLKADGQTVGVLAVQSYTSAVQYTEQDKDLLAFVGQHIGAALSRARAIEETRQRNAELALINSVQEALAREVEMQAIYEVVGEKLRDVFDVHVIDIAVLEETTGLIHFPYSIERGVRYPDEPTALSEHGFRRHVLQTGETLAINADVVEASKRFGNPVFGSGEMPESVVYAPLFAGSKATGVVSLQSYTPRPFSESDVRLLETLARSLGVALENARLLHETRQRNAELALINSVQEALAGELELQAIYDVVGDKIQEIFDAQVVDIGVFDFEAGLTSYPYAIERGVRFPDEPVSMDMPTTRLLLETKTTVLINDVEDWNRTHVEDLAVTQGDPAQSLVIAPLISGDEIRGRISLQNLDHTNAFSENDVRLLTTLAGSLSVALENARLVHETRQRNAELALINSVQSGLAGELELQAIYDLVGDKIGEIFDAQGVAISTVDEAAGLVHFPYLVERGERLQASSSPLNTGFTKHVFETREPLLINEDLGAEAERRGSFLVAGEMPRSALFVPLVTGGRATGVIALDNFDREHAFTDADLRLLTTLAGSLSAALENARLVHETRQRNAELALINSVQGAIAGELDPQAIYDIVGDRLEEVYDAQVVSISTYDEVAKLLSFPYGIERGKRFEIESMPLIGFRKHVIETGLPLLVNEDLSTVAEQYGNPPALAGEAPKSALFAPLFTRGRPSGVVSLQNVDREHAFSASDERLLLTLAGSISAALENARLVRETQQRNAELALINSVQGAIAGELDPQAIYDIVGDKIRDVFDAQAVDISVYDEATGLVHFPYSIESGMRYSDEPTPLTKLGWTRHVIETGKTVLINEAASEADRKAGIPTVLSSSGTQPKSMLFVPLVSAGRARGTISLQNLDREHAFSTSDRQLLETLVGSLGVALDNARLVHETRQRNAELALINSVQDSIAGELDPQAIYDLVGAKLQEIFDAQVVDIGVHDESAGLIRFVYQIERGVHFPNVAFPVIGFRKHVMETREPLYIDEQMDAALAEYGKPDAVVGEPSHGCAMFQPLVVGGRATGVISIQNLDREHAFSDSDRRLLATLAGSLGVALENAQLIHETRQRVAELATINSVGQAVASQLDLERLLDLVGDRVRQTFDADIAYVALHDEPAGQIDFVYYHEAGEQRQEPSLAYGEGLTSHILESREPLLLNRAEQYEGHSSVGTPSRSYLGVPIVVGERAIGVISVQSIHEEGRFGEPDARLLSTIAANVGVAIQTARLFSEIGRQKQHFESLVEISPAAVVVMDADEHVTGWNPAAADLFGYSADDALGRTIDELVLPDELRSEGRELTSAALEHGRAHRITRRACKDGSLVDVEMMLVPLMFEGEQVGFYAIYHDVGELQRAREEAESANQAKSAFLATMSHEIRTPMNAVIGMTDLLLGTELSGEQREFAEIVRSSGDALLHVIDDILDYSKIEAGKLELEREPFDLRECVEGALEIVAPRAWEKRIELGCLIDEDAPAGVVGDAARLRQVLLNLLSNAVKFTDEGEVVVHVSAERHGSSSWELELAVRDTGIGIPATRIDSLFESFSQVDASTTRRYGGTGLGLAISKRLVELMGGTISVESEEGRGSTFHIVLVAKPAEVPARIEEDDGLPQLRGKRVLIVDDNATNREIVSRHARSWDMEPVAFERPVDALELIERGEPLDVAVLDMMMPDIDGIELAREIRKRRSARELPLLLLTSIGRLSQEETSDDFGAQLSKPVRASQLYNALLRLVAEAVPEHEAPETRSSGKPDGPALRILLAEDNAVNQKVALRLLQRLGHGADVVWNGLEVLDALARQRYDVVLMDVQMPELDGLDTSRRICERWPPETRPRIIAMTANALPEDREACRAAGMDDYVAKPIRPEELANALSRVRPVSADGDRTGSMHGTRVDESAFQNLRELGGDEFLAEVIDTFVADGPTLIEMLRRSLEAGDAPEFRRAAHTLKSNGATLGAAAFSEHCRELEQLARDDRLESADELVAQIEEEYRQLEDALMALRPKVAS
ncbi:MAG TPA: GAF domain-containing protein [Gaiellaceae bacterium]|nr:GAF domain-containing protein [Gaiellaceae bacterium]